MVNDDYSARKLNTAEIVLASSKVGAQYKQLAHPHSMPHWINLSYYGSSRRQARGGKRYRPRLIPPAGLKVERRRTFVDAGT